MPIPSLPRPALILLALLCIAPALQAQEEAPPWYEVELIVFAQREPALQSERWPHNLDLPLTAESIELEHLPGAVLAEEPARPAEESEAEAALMATRPYILLPVETRRLQAEWEKLQGSSQLEPLLHVAWRQPGLAREEAVAIHLHSELANEGEKAEGATEAGNGTATVDLADEPGLLEQEPLAYGLEPIESEPPRLDGTVTLVLSRYLHLELDLAYRLPPELQPEPEPVMPVSLLGSNEPGDPFALSEAEPAAPSLPALFRFQDSRRMRSQELHYLDHPLLGVIALVTPYELPLPEPAPEPAAATGTAPVAADADLSRGSIRR